MLAPIRTDRGLSPARFERAGGISPRAIKRPLKKPVNTVLLKKAVQPKKEIKQMGFFKDLFKRKKGGTLVGNLIRGVASSATGGVLGNGTQLRAWEAEQEAKKFDALNGQISQLTQQLQANRQKIDAKQMGSDLVSMAIKNGVASPQTSPNAGESVILETLKKRWYYVVGAVAVIGGAIWLTAKKTGSKKRKNLA